VKAYSLSEVLKVGALLAGVLAAGAAVSLLYGGDTRRAKSAADPWTDAASALELARTSGKPILYEFSAGWCEPCRMLAEEVLEDPQVAGQLEHDFVLARVLDDAPAPEPKAREAEKRALAAYFGDSLPTLVVVDQSRIARLEGYHGRDQTLAFLRGGWRSR